MKRILAFHGHPDDVEWHMAATLALPATRTCRLQENARAATILGAQFHYAGGHDLRIAYDPHYFRLARGINKMRPAKRGCRNLCPW